MDFLAGADAARKSDCKLATKVLAEIEQPAEDGALSFFIASIELLGPKDKAALLKSARDCVELRGREPALFPGVC